MASRDKVWIDELGQYLTIPTAELGVPILDPDTGDLVNPATGLGISGEDETVNPISSSRVNLSGGKYQQVTLAAGTYRIETPVDLVAHVASSAQTTGINLLKGAGATDYVALKSGTGVAPATLYPSALEFSTDHIAMSAWLKLRGADATARGRVIDIGGAASQAGIRFTVDPTGFGAVIKNNSGTTIHSSGLTAVSGFTMPTDDLVHVLIGLERGSGAAGVIFFDVNGTRQYQAATITDPGSNVGVSSMVSTANLFTLGGRADAGTHGFDGELYDVRLFKGMSANDALVDGPALLRAGPRGTVLGTLNSTQMWSWTGQTITPSTDGSAVTSTVSDDGVVTFTPNGAGTATVHNVFGPSSACVTVYARDPVRVVHPGGTLVLFSEAAASGVVQLTKVG